MSLTRTDRQDDPLSPSCSDAHLGGRRAAGEDPAKREQIMEGAKRIFLSAGFDRASMNDIVREAGVSKGTIYVYFQNKEDLFGALIERERTRFVNSMRDVLSHHDDLEQVLTTFGTAFCHHMTKSDVIRSMRTVIGVIDRMPNLSRRFFTSAPANARTILKDYFDRAVEDGKLFIEDTDIASRQFIELASGGFLKLRLFGEMPEPPPQAEIERIVKSAVFVFMAAYGKKTQTNT